MEYQEFCQAFKKGVLENKEWNIAQEHYRFYAEGFTSCDPKEIEFIRHTNAKYFAIESEILKGDYAVMLVERGKGAELVMCRYAMRDLYKIYKEKGMNAIWQCVGEHMNILKQYKNCKLLPILKTYEQAKERLIFRPVNYTDNKCLLNEYIFKTYGDVALVVYVALYSDKKNLGTAKVPKSNLKKWGMEQDEIFEIAMQNTMKKMPPRLYENPWDCMTEDENEGIFMGEDCNVTELDHMSVPLVKTTSNINGAIALFYPGVKERIAELFDGSYYVVFTSIHEAHIHRVGSLPLETIQNSLQDVNAAFPKEELLSRNVFLYDANERTFEVLTKCV